jgi:hypothetical protein
MDQVGRRCSGKIILWVPLQALFGRLSVPLAGYPAGDSDCCGAGDLAVVAVDGLRINKL